MAKAILADAPALTPVLDAGRRSRAFYTITKELSLLSHFISFLRIPAFAIRQHIRPLSPIGILDQDALQMRVWPNDIDFNFHMNNARYLSLMDFGRMHLLARVRVLEHILRSR